MLTKYPECVILWDPALSNPRFHRTELTREKLLQDTTIVVLKRYNYQDTEYLLLYRNAHPVRVHENAMDGRAMPHLLRPRLRERYPLQ
jgi:hypothetical protein